MNPFFFLLFVLGTKENTKTLLKHIEIISQCMDMIHPKGLSLPILQALQNCVQGQADPSP